MKLAQEIRAGNVIDYLAGKPDRDAIVNVEILQEGRAR